MASRALLFASFVLVAVALPAAQAQGGQIVISGTVPCSIDGTDDAVFANATVQLVCGTDIISSAVTNGNGLFVIVLRTVEALLSILLNKCKLVVPTSLSSCNPAFLATGVLQSPLQLISVILGIIFNFTPTTFNLV